MPLYKVLTSDYKQEFYIEAEDWNEAADKAMLSLDTRTSVVGSEGSLIYDALQLPYIKSIEMLAGEVIR